MGSLLEGGLDILSLPISTAGFSPRAGQPDLKGWVPGEEEDESVESSIVPSLHPLQGAVCHILQGDPKRL